MSLNLHSNNSNNTYHQEVLIIGSGIAGLSAAKEIRKILKDTSITLVSSEPYLPYYRLNLTRFLSGEVEENKLFIHDSEWYRNNNINLILGKQAIKADNINKKIFLQDGTVLIYDKLLLATGSSPRKLNIKGDQLKNVLSLRTINDSKFISNKINNSDSINNIKNFTVIGGGTLGLEIAASVAKRNSNIKVIVIEVGKWLMPNQLNKNASDILKKFMHGLGVEIIENVSVEEIAGNKTCEAVITKTGEYIASDLICIATGISPNLELAKEIGLNINKGIIVDEYMKTSLPDIYAAGDAVEYNGIIYGLWNAAQIQGQTAGLNLCGIQSSFKEIPRTNILKISDISIFSIGDIFPNDSSYKIVENSKENEYNYFVYKNNKIVGSIIIGNMPLSLKLKKAIESGEEIIL